MLTWIIGSSGRKMCQNRKFPMDHHINSGPKIVVSRKLSGLSAIWCHITCALPPKLPKSKNWILSTSYSFLKYSGIQPTHFVHISFLPRLNLNIYSYPGLYRFELYPQTLGGEQFGRYVSCCGNVRVQAISGYGGCETMWPVETQSNEEELDGDQHCIWLFFCHQWTTTLNLDEMTKSNTSNLSINGWMEWIS